MKSYGIGTPLPSGLVCVLVTLLCVGTGRAAPRSAIDELAAIAMEQNPRIQAARQRLAQALIRERGQTGFFDPTLVGSAGRATDARSVPGLSRLATIPAEATVVNAAVELPVAPGLYLGVGASQRRLDEREDTEGRLYQTLFGARVRIPLLRDRGFRQYDALAAGDAARVQQAGAELLEAMQTTRHEVEQSYLAAWLSSALVAIARQATERFETLRDEAEKLVELGVTPAYQVFPATLELDLRRADELNARQTHAIRLVELARAVGMDKTPNIQGDAASLIGEAGSVASEPITSPLSVPSIPRGTLQALHAGVQAARAELIQARDNARSDLALEVGATWQGESADDVMGDERILSEDHVESEALIVWQRPLGFRTEKSAVQEIRARLAELDALIRNAELELEAALRAARIAFGSARERLTLLSQAVQAAQQAVDAERQRFRLGEGRSRNVLDAQKDLTDSIRRQAQIAAAVLLARSDYLFAIGANVPGFTLEPELDRLNEGEMR